jgi:hypothetical protein
MSSTVEAIKDILFLYETLVTLLENLGRKIRAKSVMIVAKQAI